MALSTTTTYTAVNVSIRADPSGTCSSDPAHKKRRRIFTADDRALHRVIEKQRREALNDNFVDLARLLPDLASTRRLSKGLIVSASIAHHKRQRARRQQAARVVRALLAERDQLRTEVDELRARLGDSAVPRARETSVESQMSQDLAEVLAAEEVCGAFPNGFGDNGAGDDSGEGGDGVVNMDGDTRVNRGRRMGSEGARASSEESGRHASSEDSLSPGAAGRSPPQPGSLPNLGTLADHAAMAPPSDAIYAPMLEDTPPELPMAPPPLTDDELLAMLSVDTVLGGSGMPAALPPDTFPSTQPASLPQMAPSSLPEVYPDKLYLDKAYPDRTALDLTPSQIEEVWRQLGMAGTQHGVEGAAACGTQAGSGSSAGYPDADAAMEDDLFALPMYAPAPQVEDIFGF